MRPCEENHGCDKAEGKDDITIGGVSEIVDGTCYQATAADKEHGDADACGIGFDVLFFDFGIVVRVNQVDFGFFPKQESDDNADNADGGVYNESEQHGTFSYGGFSFILSQDIGWVYREKAVGCYLIDRGVIERGRAVK